MDKEAQKRFYNIIATLRKTQIKIRMHISRLERRLSSKRLTREEKGLLMNSIRALYYLDFIIEWMLVRSETLLISNLVSKNDIEFLKDISKKVYTSIHDLEPDLTLPLLEIDNLLSNIEVTSSSIGKIDESALNEVTFAPMERKKEIDEILKNAAQYADNKIKSLLEKI